MFFLDPRYLLFMMPAILLMMLAQMYVSSAYRKWSQVQSRSRLSGAQAAQRLIQSGGLYDVHVEASPATSPTITTHAVKNCASPKGFIKAHRWPPWRLLPMN